MPKLASERYSAKTLKALEQILKAHRALIWIDPATNSLAVKRVFDRAAGVQSPPAGVSYA